MGARTSREAAAVVGAAWTVKVILPDGKLREYAGPVTAAVALGINDASFFFVCDADEMEFDGFVSAVGADEGLRPGQLYFVLPRSMLKHPLHAKDLAALALKASAELLGPGWRCGRGQVAPLVFPAGDGDWRREEKSRRPKAGGGGGRTFAPELSAIPE